MGNGNGIMSGAFGGAVDEARHMGQGVLNLLGEQNDVLKQLRDKPAGKPLSRLNVVSEGQIRVVNTPQMTNPEFYEVLRTPPGQLIRIEHWAWMLVGGVGASDIMALAIGDGQNIVGIIDIQDSPGNGIRGGKSNPQGMILPPNTPLLATATPGQLVHTGVMTLFYNSYELSL